MAWPAGQILRFDQRQTLRFHTLPDASVDVTLGIVRPVEAHGLRVAGQRVYDVTMHGRADRRGYVSVPLRYAYVPTRPTPVTLTVTVHEGRRTIQRRATMMLVRR